MAMKKQKSLASLVKRDIKPNEVNQASSKIHRKVNDIDAIEVEKTIRVSVDTPKSIYSRAQEVRIKEGFKSLKDFYLHCITNYMDNK